MARLPPLALALPFSLFGVYATVGTLVLNGFSDIAKLVNAGVYASFPGAPAPFRRVFTGLAPVDVIFQNAIGFFVALVNGDGKDTAPEWWLFYVWAMTNFMLGTAIMFLEARRTSRARGGGAIAWASMWGVAFQVVAFTTVVPVWLSVHLMTSATADAVGLDDVLFGSGVDAAVLPMALAVAFVLPAAVMTLPDRFGTSAHSHYLWHTLWQVFPVTVASILAVARTVFSSSNRHWTTPSQHLARSRWTYGTLIAIAVAVHLPTLTLSLLPSPLRAALAEALPDHAALIHGATFRNIFVPDPPYPWCPTLDPLNPRSRDLVPAALNLLRYDALVPSLPLLVWAVAVYGRARGGVRDDEAKGTLRGAARWLVLGGPYATVLWLLWERDAVVCRVAEGEGKKNK